MEGLCYGGRFLYRYKAVSETSRHGSVTLRYEKAERYWMNVIPLSERHDRTESGIREGRRALVSISNCRSFSPGDRIGDEERTFFDVEEVSTFSTIQQLTVRQCRR